MTGLVLVVDDVPANVKLLEAKLTSEYYDVVTAKDGYEAIAQAKEHKPDLILLDVMMPGMDGFETCRQLKKDHDVSHIPVVMVTALSEPSDRVEGLEAGADDFITKPINDTALFARVRSLIRIKVLIDELRLRDQSGSEMGISDSAAPGEIDVSGSHVVVIDDDAVQSKRLKEKLSESYVVEVYADHEQAIEKLKVDETVDLIVVNSMLTDIDGLRLATQFKAIETLRHVPVIMMVDEDDQALMLKALELGVNDYLILPIDYNEMLARVKTQIRRKRFQDALKSNYQESMSMAITDGLTRLYNRHYLDTHLGNLTKASLENGKSMSMIIMDMDHFKSVNDNYGHDVGDEILRDLAKIIMDSFRSADLAARYGGEEFVVLMPETDFASAYDVADRMRHKIESTPFTVSHEIGQLTKTVSIGVSSLNLEGDTAEALLKRADTALYAAKNGGRNQVCPKPGDSITSPVAAQPAPNSLAEPAPQSLTPAAPLMAAVPLQPLDQPTVATEPAPQSLVPPQPLTPPAPQAAPAQETIYPVEQPVTAPPFNSPQEQVAFNHGLEDELKPEEGIPTAPNDLAIQTVQKESVSYEIVKPAGQDAKPKESRAAPDNSGASTIDDEPPGTF